MPGFVPRHRPAQAQPRGEPLTCPWTGLRDTWSCGALGPPSHSMLPGAGFNPFNPLRLTFCCCCCCLSGWFWGSSALQWRCGGNHFQWWKEVRANEKAWDLHHHLPLHRVDWQHHGPAAYCSTGLEQLDKGQQTVQLFDQSISQTKIWFLGCFLVFFVILCSTFPTGPRNAWL